MSKYVKNLVTEHIRHRLEDVDDALLVNVIGLDANTSSRLRTEMRSKNIHLMVVKNSLAARATPDTPLAPLFDGVAGSAAICWGSEDIVSLAKRSPADQRRPFKPPSRPRRRDGRRAAHRPRRSAKSPSGPAAPNNSACCWGRSLVRGPIWQAS